MNRSSRGNMADLRADAPPSAHTVQTTAPITSKVRLFATPCVAAAAAAATTAVSGAQSAAGPLSLHTPNRTALQSAPISSHTDTSRQPPLRPTMNRHETDVPTLQPRHLCCHSVPVTAPVSPSSSSHGACAASQLQSRRLRCLPVPITAPVLQHLCLTKWIEQLIPIGVTRKRAIRDALICARLSEGRSTISIFYLIQINTGSVR